MHPARLQDLTCRTEINVTLRIVTKGFIAEDAVVVSGVGFAGRVSQSFCFNLVSYTGGLNGKGHSRAGARALPMVLTLAWRLV
jgi:hypothetical protein